MSDSSGDQVNRRRAGSSAVQRRQSIRTKDNQNFPLSREFFGELIKMENIIKSKSYDLEILDELTQYYAVHVLWSN